jgi:exonuclease 3'-5' domain-containing protein 1
LFLFYTELDIFIDPELTTRILNFLENCVKQQMYVSIEQLFNLVIQKFPEAMTMFKTQQDLSTFLKMTPNIFIVQSNAVSRKVKSFDKDMNVETDDQIEKNKRKKSSEDLEKNQSNHLSLNRQVSVQPNSQPDSLTSNSSSSQPNSLTSNTIEISNSVSPPVSLQQQTLKQRINNLLMKTLAENTERDRILQNAVIGEALKSRVSQQTKIIVNLRDCLQKVNDIMYPRKPSTDGKIVISLDSEGINVGPKGKLTLLQIGTMSGHVYIFDLITCPNIIQSGGLQKLLESENVIKVNLFHYLYI